MRIYLRWGSAPHPGSVARGGPDAPLRSLAGALCAPRAVGDEALITPVPA
jgi:hypothetical protein